MIREDIVKYVKDQLTAYILNIKNDPKNLRRTLTIPEGGITPKNLIYEDLGMDSIDRWEFFYRIENHFSLEIKDERIQGFEDVNEIVDYLMNHTR